MVRVWTFQLCGSVLTNQRILARDDIQVLENQQKIMYKLAHKSTERSHSLTKNIILQSPDGSYLKRLFKLIQMNPIRGLKHSLFESEIFLNMDMNYEKL